MSAHLRTPLQRAAFFGDAPRVEELATRADCDDRGAAFALAASRGHTALALAVLRSGDVTDQLRVAGAYAALCCKQYGTMMALVAETMVNDAALAGMLQLITTGGHVAGMLAHATTGRAD